MLIKKAAVPLINEKILSQAVHCYIVTSGISTSGFDFIRTRIPEKCRIDIVTGLDEATSPDVLNRILSHYQGRINLHIYTRNILNANVYIFDLPFRKSVAFVGSGSLTLEGLKDHEEIFWKVTDAKEIESLLSWFTGYFEFGIPLTEDLVKEYEILYPELKTGEAEARREKRNALTVASSNFALVRFKNQYFKKEDYDILTGVNSKLENDGLLQARGEIISKLEKLTDPVRIDLERISLYPLKAEAAGVSNIDPSHKRVNSIYLSFGKNPSGFNPGPAVLQMGISASHFALRLAVRNDSDYERLKFRDQSQEAEFRTNFYQELVGLGNGYFIEAGSNRKPVEFFKQEQMLMEFMQSDPDFYSPIFIERVYSPGENAITNEQIGGTVLNEFKRLGGLLKYFVS